MGEWRAGMSEPGCALWVVEFGRGERSSGEKERKAEEEEHDEEESQGRRGRQALSCCETLASQDGWDEGVFLHVLLQYTYTQQGNGNIWGVFLCYNYKVFST